MNNLKTGLLALALLGISGTPALAQQAPGVQLGLAGGISKYHDGCGGTTSCDDSGRALRASLGYALGNGLVLEGFAMDFGKLTVKSSDLGITGEIGVRSFGAGVAFHLPLGGPVDGVLRLGLASHKLKVTASGFGITVSESQSSTAAIYGVGLAWRVTSSAAVELAWHRSSAKLDGEKGDFSAYTVGVNLGF